MFLNEKIKNLFKISFVRDVGMLQVGTVFSAGLAVVASVVFARILGAANYGIYSLIFALVGLVGIFRNLGAERACLTLLPEAYAKKDKQEIRNILTYFVKVTLLVTVTISLIGIIFAPLLSDLLYHNLRVGQLARWVLVADILAAVFLLLTVSLQSIRKIKYLTILEFINKSLYKLLPITFVLLGLGLLGIVWGYLLSAILFLFFSIFVYLKMAQRNKYFPNFREIFQNFNKIKFRKYFNFGFLIAVDNNLSNLAGLLPIILLGMFALPQEVAYFKIALAYITIPSLLITPVSRILAVQLPKSKAQSLELLKEHFFRVSFYTGLITLTTALVLSLLAPFLIKLFYGQEFLPSIPLVYFLAINVILSGFAIGFGAIYRTLNKMKIPIILNTGQVIFMILLILFLMKFFAPLKAIVLTKVIASILSTSLNFYLIKNIIYQKIHL